jgi:hypothetical protein
VSTWPETSGRSTPDSGPLGPSRCVVCSPRWKSAAALLSIHSD